MKDYLTMRRDAGTPRGNEFARRLDAMSPQDAADELYDAVRLCADEDLVCEIRDDFRVENAELIAAAILRRRRHA